MQKAYPSISPAESLNPPDSVSCHANVCGRSPVWLGHRLPKYNINIDLKNGLSFNWLEFMQCVKAKYSKSYSPTILCYANNYKHLINGNLRDLETLSEYKRNHVIKSLIALSKFLGIHKEFKQRLLDYGIKLSTPNGLASFLRILHSNNSDILKWYQEALPILTDNQRTLLRFLLLSGLRKEEAITSFNKIIQLNNDNKLNEYYDSSLNCLCHFKYPKEFIRRTKNVYISFITEDLLNKIANSESVTYNTIIKRLHGKAVKCRINELRDYYGTYLLQHGILEAEINLLQGRMPPSIFIKHYWSPKLSELRDRIFEILRDLEPTLGI